MNGLGGGEPGLVRNGASLVAVEIAVGIPPAEDLVAPFPQDAAGGKAEETLCRFVPGGHTFGMIDRHDCLAASCDAVEGFASCSHAETAKEGDGADPTFER